MFSGDAKTLKNFDGEAGWCFMWTVVLSSYGEAVNYPVMVLNVSGDDVDVHFCSGKREYKYYQSLLSFV